MSASNIVFQVIDPPTPCRYVSVNGMVCVQRVLWKGDWCLTIVRDPDHREFGCPEFRIYNHWKDIGFVNLTAHDIFEARDKVTEFMLNFEKFLREKFFRPKIAVNPIAEEPLCQST